MDDLTVKEGEDQVMKTPRIKVLTDLIKKIDNKNVKTFLDIGCGNGHLTERIFMKHFNADFYGIDMGDGAERAKEKGINAFKADLNEIDKLKFEDNYFDSVFAGEIIEHLVDPDKFLEEIHRILKKDGLLILSTPNLAAWYNRILLLFGYQPFWTDSSFKYPYAGKIRKEEGNGQHLRVSTYRSMKALLNLHGYNIKCIKGTFAANIEILSFLGFIEKISWKIPSLSSDLIFICKKN